MHTPSFRDLNMDAPVPVIAVRSLRIPSAGRGEDLQVRVSAPLSGTNLPVVLFSHGFGASMDAYAPLVDYWAAHGFVVVQPTYLDARRLALGADDPRRPLLWRMRVSDAVCAIDNLESLVAQVPGLAGRVAFSLLAAVGHSFGGHTTSLLLGARMASMNETEDFSDSRIKTGVLLASGGTGGKDLSPLGREITPYLDTTFGSMITPTLVVAGDQDNSPLTLRGPDWFYDPYRLSPGSKALLTLFGAEHMLGGISGYAVAETTDEDTERVALLESVTTTYLAWQLLGDDRIWTATREALAASSAPRGKIESKGHEALSSMADLPNSDTSTNRR